MGPRKGPRPEANPRPIFQGLVIAVTGFKGGEWNETNMSRWISLRKGRLSSQMDASVTHLICSEEDVKNKHPKVREAQKRGIKNCKLVTLDWLEDSIHAKRVLPEGDFSPQKALLKAKKIEARKKQVEKGFEQAVKTVNTNLYHHYQDHTYFTYVVTLRRDHVTPGERYVLFLEESNNSKPHLYWFFAKYYKNKGNTYAHVYRPSFTSGLFQREFDHFKHFFKTKTGIDWDDRLIKEGMAPADKRFFVYTSPTPSEAHAPGPEARYIASEADAQREENSTAASASNHTIAVEAKPSPQPEPPIPKKKIKLILPKPKPKPVLLLTTPNTPQKDRRQASGLGTSRKRKAGPSSPPCQSKPPQSRRPRSPTAIVNRKGGGKRAPVAAAAATRGGGRPAATKHRDAGKSRPAPQHDGDRSRGDGSSRGRGGDELKYDHDYLVRVQSQRDGQEMRRWRLFATHLLRQQQRQRREQQRGDGEGSCSGCGGGGGGGGGGTEGGAGGDRPHSGGGVGDLDDDDDEWSEEAVATGSRTKE